MFSPADQPSFTLTLAGADVQVVAFKGREALSRPFIFDLELVAEGVETGEQLEFLLAAGCRVIQGYYFYPDYFCCNESSPKLMSL